MFTSLPTDYIHLCTNSSMDYIIGIYYCVCTIAICYSYLSIVYHDTIYMQRQFLPVFHRAAKSPGSGRRRHSPISLSGSGIRGRAQYGRRGGSNLEGDGEVVIQCFPKMEAPQHCWFKGENPSNIDDLGVPLFQETTILEYQVYMLYLSLRMFSI